MIKILNVASFLDTNRTLQNFSESFSSRILKEIGSASDSGASIISACDNSTSTAGPGSGKSMFFKGAANRSGANSSDSITFVSLDSGQYIKGQNNSNGSVQISYRLMSDKESETGYSLVREEIPLISPKSKACEKSVIFPISSNVVSLNFRYYDEKAKKWSDDWNEKNIGIPSLVEISYIISLSGQGGNQFKKKYLTSVAIKKKK